MDIDGSSYVAVRNCTVITADDAICLKATVSRAAGGGPTRHVEVSNCTLQSRSSAFKIGSESRAEMSNISVSNVQVRWADPVLSSSGQFRSAASAASAGALGECWADATRPDA